jgi:hypothetical protein
MNVYIVYAAGGFALITYVLGGILLWRIPDGASIEVQKLRFAASMFTGILIVFVFAALLYIATPDGGGQDVFKTAMTAMTPLAGAMMGYIFGTRGEGRGQHGGGTSADPPKPDA